MESFIENGQIKIRNMSYKVLLLPNTKALPVETLEAIRQYVAGGGVVIAFDEVPDKSTGFINYRQNDQRVQEIMKEMFVEPFGHDAIGTVEYGNGHTHWLKYVIDRRIWWDQRSSALDPFLNTIRSYVPPDFGIDFAYEGIRNNEGLCFVHRTIGDMDVYFVTNIQDRASTKPITFRVKDKSVWEWNPFNAEIKPINLFSQTDVGTKVPLNLLPYESTFIVFQPEKPTTYVQQTDLDEIINLSESTVEGLASNNGTFYATVFADDSLIEKKLAVSDVPAPLNIAGNWHFLLSGKDFPGMETTINTLYSWTDGPKTRHVSGQGKYEIEFDVPDLYLNSDNVVLLDLGKVGNIAEVVLNGHKVGTVWMREQKLNVTEALKSGKNKLVVLVTNTGINRASAFKEPPPVPQELVARFGSGLVYQSAREFGFSPLPPSGLMGPVRLIIKKKVKTEY